LSRFVTRPGTRGVSIYKSGDPPPPALSHFFVPDLPPSSSLCPPSPPPSSSPTAAFCGAHGILRHRRPLPHGIIRRRRPPEICRPPTRRRPHPPPRCRSATVGPRNAGGFLPDLPRPPWLLIPILRAVLPGLRGSSSPYSALSSPTSGAPLPRHADRLAARPA
jgi:hypothetical protein